MERDIFGCFVTGKSDIIWTEKQDLIYDQMHSSLKKATCEIQALSMQIEFLRMKCNEYKKQIKILGDAVNDKNKIIKTVMNGSKENMKENDKPDEVIKETTKEEEDDYENITKDEYLIV